MGVKLRRFCLYYIAAILVVCAGSFAQDNPDNASSPANPDAAAPTEPAAEGGATDQSQSSSSSGDEADIFITVKEGARQRGPSRIYDAFDGRMIRNDVSMRFRVKKNEAMRKYDNGTHGDEVGRDGVPSRILINDTDYIGPRTAANYDELKGLLFTIGSDTQGAQRYFGLSMVSLDWDGEDIPIDTNLPTEAGVYRLTSLEKRMFAFIMEDSQDISRAFQNAEGKDLLPTEDSVDPPTGLDTNTQESRRPTNGIQTWNAALADGSKKKLERQMMSALAGTEIASASWFPSKVSAIQIAGYRPTAAGSLSNLGMGMGMGMGMGGMGMGMGGYGGLGAMGMGGYGGGYGGMMGGIQGFTPAASAMGIAGGF